MRPFLRHLRFPLCEYNAQPVMRERNFRNEDNGDFDSDLFRDRPTRRKQHFCIRRVIISKHFRSATLLALNEICSNVPRWPRLSDRVESVRGSARFRKKNKEQQTSEPCFPDCYKTRDQIAVPKGGR